MVRLSVGASFVLLLLLPEAGDAFAPASVFRTSSTTTTTTTTTTTRTSRSGLTVNAEIRGPTSKSETLRFGWDGSTALGGAVEVARPSRMLEEIRAAGESIPEECVLFNANLEMDASDLKFQDVMDMIDRNYESQLLQFRNGDIVNAQGENEGSAKLLSYAALSNLDKETTLLLWGEHHRQVRANPEGTDHANIRNFMKYGWDGVPFENGIALTKKAVGDADWDPFAESWIP